MIKLFATLGPASLNKKFLSCLNPKYIKLLRINLSHTDYKDLKKVVGYIRRYTKIEICFDTGGAQIRTSKLTNNKLILEKNKFTYISKNILDIYQCSAAVKLPVQNSGCQRRTKFTYISKNNLVRDCISIYPKNIYQKLRNNDVLSIDFNSAKIKIVGKNTNYLKCKIIEGGKIESNKSISVNRFINIPAFTDNDINAFKIAQDLKIRNIALSFTSHADDVIKLRKYFKYKINIISKIESKKGLKNLKLILKETNSVLIDRGDLSKEIPLQLIPKVQKEIINVAKKNRVPVYVATNLLESMVSKREPTRAEVNDIYNTLLDGATGLVLAAETAIGKYPLECIDMIIKVSKTVRTNS